MDTVACRYPLILMTMNAPDFQFRYGWELFSDSQPDYQLYQCDSRGYIGYSGNRLLEELALISKRVEVSRLELLVPPIVDFQWPEG